MADEQKRQGQQVPSVGRIVHYVLDNGDHRPAVIVKVWAEQPTAQTACNLHVFLDKFDGAVEQDVTSRQQGEGPGTWHWPEYVPAQ